MIFKETPSIKSIKKQEHNHQLTEMDRFLKNLGRRLQDSIILYEE